MPVLPTYATYGGIFDDEMLHYQAMMGAAHAYPDPTWLGSHPPFHGVPDEYTHLQYPKMAMPLQLAPPGLYGPPSNAHPADSPISVDQHFYVAPMGYRHVFNESRDQRYHSPTGPMGGSLSDASSEYGVSPDVAHRAMPFGGSPTASHVLRSMTAESPLNHPGMWAISPPHHPLLSPTDELVPTMNAIAMKELEFECTGPTMMDHHCFDGPADSTAPIQLPLLLSPEELDLSESPATQASLSRTTTESSQTTESSDYEAIASVYDHESDSDFDPSKRRQSIKTSPSSHPHGRHPSTTSMRSVRPHSSNRPVLSTVSRVQKSKGTTPARTSAKEKGRAKMHPYRTTSTGSTRAERASKAFPCAFHHFGCHSVFANKNEWKRHNYSQHLQLDFFRCDLGSCNPEFNPKLYVTPERRPPGGDREDNNQDDEREVIYNDFGRKDLFTQHCRRMHGPHRYHVDATTATNQLLVARASSLQHSSPSKLKAKLNITKDDEAAFEVELDVIRARCHMIRRKAPSRSSCGFCSRIFEADYVVDDGGKAEERAWEERLEHVGRHYERDGCHAQDESLDDDLVEWGLSMGVLHTVHDKHGNVKPWLVDCEVRDTVAAPEADRPQTLVEQSGTDNSARSQRKGLRSRKCSRTESRSSARAAANISDSEDDASAEDE